MGTAHVRAQGAAAALGRCQTRTLLPAPPTCQPPAALVAWGAVTSPAVAAVQPSCPRGHRRLIQLLQIIMSFKKKSPGLRGVRRWQRGHEPAQGAEPELFPQVQTAVGASLLPNMGMRS